MYVYLSIQAFKPLESQQLGRSGRANILSMRPWAPTLGGWGRTRPPSQKVEEGRPPEIVIFKLFQHLTQSFRFLRIFKIKWPKSEEKQECGGRWVWRARIRPPPQWKLRGGATWCAARAKRRWIRFRTDRLHAARATCDQVKPLIAQDSNFVGYLPASMPIYHCVVRHLAVQGARARGEGGTQHACDPPSWYFFELDTSKSAEW